MVDFLLEIESYLAKPDVWILVATGHMLATFIIASIRTSLGLMWRELMDVNILVPVLPGTVLYGEPFMKIVTQLRSFVLQFKHPEFTSRLTSSGVTLRAAG